MKSCKGRCRKDALATGIKTLEIEDVVAGRKICDECNALWSGRSHCGCCGRTLRANIKRTRKSYNASYRKRLAELKAR